MRTVFCCLLLVFGGFITLQAQRFTGGLVVGLNLTQIDGDNQGGYRQFGLKAGGFVQYPLGPNLWLQPELIFDQMGARDQNGLFNIRLQYISLPVMIQATIPVELDEGKPFPVRLEAGLEGGYLLSSRDAAFDRPLLDPLTRADLRASLGVEFRMGPRSAFHIRFGRSIVSIFPNTGMPTFSRPGATGLFNRYASFDIRYYLKPVN